MRPSLYPAIRMPRPMLSRVADSLYWIGRYTERAESTTRLLQTHLNLQLDLPQQKQTKRLYRHLESLLGEEAGHSSPNLQERLVFADDTPFSVLRSIDAARANARNVRDYIPSEIWEAINRMYLSLVHPNARVTWQSQPDELFRRLSRGFRVQQGCADASMSRSEGWHFMRLGRYLERGLTTASLLKTHFESVPWPIESDVAEGEHIHEWIDLLLCSNAAETYRRVHTANIKPERVVALLLFDASFPQSIAFTSSRVLKALEAIGDATGQHHHPALVSATRGIDEQLSHEGRRESALLADPLRLLRDLRSRFVEVHEIIHEVYIGYPVEERLPRD